VVHFGSMSIQPKTISARTSIASVWHTCCLLALLAMFSALSVYLRMGSTTARIGHLPLYSLVVVFEWSLFAFSLWRSDTAFVGYVAPVLHNPRSLLWDIPGALILAGLLLLISPLIVRILGQTGWHSMQGMLPSNRIEIAAWIVMAVTAGICEETVFRGYLQHQISGWSGNVVVGILGQAVIFGLCHAYQGWKKVALIFVWGCGFGAFAWLRKGLRANMIAHAVLDIISIF
jgi:uncharacterized protein